MASFQTRPDIRKNSTVHHSVRKDQGPKGVWGKISAKISADTIRWYTGYGWEGIIGVS